MLKEMNGIHYELKSLFIKFQVIKFFSEKLRWKNILLMPKSYFCFFARLGWKIVVTRNRYRVAWFGWPDFFLTIFTKGATAVTQILQLMIVLSP